jgi:two-component system cell cycle sensor histidine kinase/response regulator CckA
MQPTDGPTGNQSGTKPNAAGPRGASEPPGWQQRPAREGRRKVLVVEDEALIALDLERRVTRMGFDVVGTADNRDEAVELFLETRPDLVLMDIFIRGPVDGVETARSIGQLGDVPVIFLTAFADSDTVGRAAAVSPYGYLLKPFDDNTLAATVRVALERHGADTQLRLLRAAVESAQVGIELTAVTGDARDVVYVNSALATLRGSGRNDGLGQPAWLLSREPTDEAIRRLQTAMRGCTRGEGVVAFKDAKGATRYAAVTVSPVVDHAGKVTHLMSHFVDITRQRATESALEVSQRTELMGRLTANVAHDFNNVLGAIVAFAELARDGVEAEEARQDIDEVLTAARRGAALTRKLLDFTRANDPERQVHSDVNDVLRKLRPMLERIAGPRIHIELGLPEEQLVAGIDSHSLEQVVLNLVTNARDAMPSGGRIALAASMVPAIGPRPRMVRVDVQDDGTGMSDEVRRRIFEPLFTTKPSGKGTGLGLAICQMLVDRAGGGIRVTSEVGQGTTITFELPLSSSAIEPSAEQPVAPRVGNAGGALCLLVDDEHGLRRACARALADAGFQVIEAPDGEQAVREIDAQGDKLQIIISDLMLPGISGEDVIAHARTVVPSALTLLITGYVDRPPEAFATDQLVLWKPFTTSALIRSALDALNSRPTAG